MIAAPIGTHGEKVDSDIGHLAQIHSFEEQCIQAQHQNKVQIISNCSHHRQFERQGPTTSDWCDSQGCCVVSNLPLLHTHASKYA